MGKAIKGVSSSIRDHVSSTGRSASVEDFCILNNAGTELDLLVHESLLILRNRPTLKSTKFFNTLVPFFNAHRLCLSSLLVFPY